MTRSSRLVESPSPDVGWPAITLRVRNSGFVARSRALPVSEIGLSERDLTYRSISARRAGQAPW